MKITKTPLVLSFTVLTLLLLAGSASAIKIKTRKIATLDFFPKIYLDDKPAEGATIRITQAGKEIRKEKTDSRGNASIQLPLYKDYVAHIKVRGQEEVRIDLLGATLPTGKVIFEYVPKMVPDVKIYSNAYIKKKGAYGSPYFNPRNYEITMMRIRWNGKAWAEDQQYAQNWFSGTLLGKVMNAERDLRKQMAELQEKLESQQAWQQMRIDLGEKYSQLQRISGAIYYGDYLENPLASAEVELRDKSNKVVETVTTSEMGNFVFTQVTKGESFSISMKGGQDIPGNVRIAITNDDREIIKEGKTSSDGGFDFDFLPSDKHSLELMAVEDTDLVIDFDGILLAGAGEDAKAAKAIQVELKDTEGNVVAKSTTENNGAFHFDKVPAEKDYAFNITPAEAAKVGSDKVSFTTAEGQLISTVEKGADGGFAYEMLPADKFEMGTLQVADPWIDIMAFEDLGEQDFVISEDIHFATNESEVSPEDLIILNKVVRVLVANKELKLELSTHSDSRGSDEANLALSQKRAESCKTYMLEKGIDPLRIVATGKGETQLVNDCANGVECTDEQHAQNRRAEFRVFQ